MMRSNLAWIFALVLAACSSDRLLQQALELEKELDAHGIAFHVSQREHTQSDYTGTTTYTIVEVKLSVAPDLATKPTNFEESYKACRDYHRVVGELLRSAAGLETSEASAFELKQNLLYQFTLPVARIEMERAEARLDHALLQVGLSWTQERSGSGASSFRFKVLGTGTETTLDEVARTATMLEEALELLPYDLLIRKKFESSLPPSSGWDRYVPKTSGLYQLDGMSSSPPREPKFEEKHSRFATGRFDQEAKSKLHLVKRLVTQSKTSPIDVAARTVSLEVTKAALDERIAALKTWEIVFSAADPARIDRDAYKTYRRERRFDSSEPGLPAEARKELLNIATALAAYAGQWSVDHPGSSEAQLAVRRASALRDFADENP
jgi:hypothetical protein